jgi:hypothetical protein
MEVNKRDEYGTAGEEDQEQMPKEDYVANAKVSRFGKDRGRKGRDVGIG